MRVTAIECAVFRYPEGFDGWHMFRMEYGGHAENCLMEAHVWMPPTTTREQVHQLERLLGGEEGIHHV